MNASIARTYNELAAPALRQMGIEVVDTFSSGLRNPQLSADGVHFPGELSRQHAQAVLHAMCGITPAVDPLLNNPYAAAAASSTHVSVSALRHETETRGTRKVNRRRVLYSNVR